MSEQLHLRQAHGRVGRLLEHIDEGLEALFRARLPLSAPDVDVSFEAPDREWSATLTRPTVNVGLWDIRRSSERAKSGIQTVVRDGVRVHQPAFPVVELRYVVTAWTADIRDERVLLSGLTRVLLATGSIPGDFLSPTVSHLEDPTLLMARAGEEHMDVFKALEGKVKPGLNIIVTTEFDSGVGIEAGPPTTSIGLRIGYIDQPKEAGPRRIAGEIVDAAERNALGAIVSTEYDATTVNPAGHFLLTASPGETVTVHTDPPLTAIVPPTGGIRFD